MNKPTCKSCRSTDLRPFFEVSGIPVHSCVLQDSAEAALAYPRGELKLEFCRRCGFVQNGCFDPSVHEYSPRYEETQGYSPRFREWLEGLARRMVEDHGVRGRRVLEIGCGKGDFLALLCRIGGNLGIGVDPAYDPARRPPEADDRVTYLPEFYGERHVGLEADFVCCRHTLEHIDRTADFLGLVRRSIGDREATLFLEVPDVDRVLDDLAFWDVYYEHCSYFNSTSLTRLLQATGFEVLECWREYGDQYLMVVARSTRLAPACPATGDVAATERRVDRFEAHIGPALEDWDSLLRSSGEEGRRTILWGSGSKAVAFLTTLGLNGEVEALVDVNPHRHGRFVPGTAHAIVSPDSLSLIEPDTVVVMNRVYREEISAQLAKMGLEPELVALP